MKWNMELESERNDNVGFKLFIFIVVFAVIFLAGFSTYLIPRIQKKAETYEINSPVLRKKVLIATQGSQFKDQFISNFTFLLGKEPVFIKVVDINFLSEVSPEKWNVILIVSSIKMGYIKPKAKEFIVSMDNPENIILVTTSSTDEWEYEDSRLDIISSASDKYEIETVIYSVLARVKLILNL